MRKDAAYPSQAHSSWNPRRQLGPPNLNLYLCMVLCCLRGVFACVGRTWLPLEHSLLLSEPCWGNGCLHSTWLVVCIFAGCCWCNLCVNITEYIYIYIYVHPHPMWIYPLNSSKKVVQKRDDTNQHVDVLQSTFEVVYLYVLNTLSLSLRMIESRGVWKERWLLFKFVVPGRHPFLFAKKAETWEWTPDAESSPTNPTNQPIQNIKKLSSIHVLNLFVANTSSGLRPNNSHLEQWRLERTNRFVLDVDSIFCFTGDGTRIIFFESKIKENWRWKSWLMCNFVSENLWNPDDLCW